MQAEKDWNIFGHLPYCMPVRQGHGLGGVLVLLLPSVFTDSWGIVGMIVSNQQLFRETELRSVASLICKHQF